jgi:hypothetical protein
MLSVMCCLGRCNVKGRSDAQERPPLALFTWDNVNAGKARPQLLINSEFVLAPPSRWLIALLGNNLVKRKAPRLSGAGLERLVQSPWCGSR